MSSLKELVRTRILIDMVKSVQPPGKWKMLIIDPLSLAIVNSVCKLHEILDENVTLIEDITRKRQAYSNKEAIYFITPSPSSISELVKDFSGPKPMYAAAHVFCTSALSDALFDMIKNSPLTAGKYVKTLRELNVDFIATEQQVFSFERPSNFYTIYKPNPDTGDINDEFRQIAKKMMSVFSTVAEMPNIRYFDPANARVNKASKLAGYIQEELDLLAQQDPDFPSKDSPAYTGKNGTLLIIERTFDMAAPLLHEFTYQAMINDLLLLQNGKISVKAEEGESKGQPATLDENDSIWKLIRHWHFADAVEFISEAFNRFISSNKAASAAMAGHNGPKGIESLNEMKDTLGALPEFQEMKSKFSLHINICQQCKTMLGEKRIDACAAVEQDLATGETSDGRPIKGAMASLVPVLYDQNVSNVDKIRLLMLYIICQEGINDNDRRKLLDCAKLSLEESQAIGNLANMGVRLVPYIDSSEKKAAQELRGPYSYRGKKYHRSKGDNDDVPFDLSRYVPLLKLAMEDSVTNSMSTKYFPFTREPKGYTDASSGAKGGGFFKPSGGGSTNNLGTTVPMLNGAPINSTGTNPYSLRTQRANWASGAKKKMNNFNNSLQAGGEDGEGAASNPLSKATGVDAGISESILLNECRKNGPRLMVFVIGGITYSEIRSCYEIMREWRREVIIGSTHIITPTMFVETLRELHKSDPRISTPGRSSVRYTRDPVTNINSLGSPATPNSTSSPHSEGSINKAIYNAPASKEPTRYTPSHQEGNEVEEKKSKLAGFFKKK